MERKPPVKSDLDSANEPILLVQALHFRSVVAMLAQFLQVRRVSLMIAHQPGFLKVHRWASRRSLMVMSWWQDEASLAAWRENMEYKSLLARVRQNPEIGYWEEMFRPLPGGIHQGQGVGTPPLPPTRP